jgi:hypothetical protein
MFIQKRNGSKEEEKGRSIYKREGYLKERIQRKKVVLFNGCII